MSRTLGALLRTRRLATLFTAATLAVPAITSAALAVDDAPEDATTVESPDRPVRRLKGEDRVGTAIDVVLRTWDTAPSVIIASSREYADALAAAPLSGTLDIPVLLTRPDTVSAGVLDAIDALGASSVHVLGGPAAISPDVAAALSDHVGDVQRIAGDNRFGTSAAIARAVVEHGGDASTVFLVEGRNADPTRGWADSLAVSSVAARLGHPVLLVEHQRLPDEAAEVLAELAPSRIVTVGGNGAVSKKVVQAAARAAGGATTERWSGKSRFATSMAVADESGLESTAVWLATGLGWADALAAGPAAAHDDAILLLVHGRSVANARQTADWVAANSPEGDLVVIGGNEAMKPKIAELFGQEQEG